MIMRTDMKKFFEAIVQRFGSCSLPGVHQKNTFFPVILHLTQPMAKL